MTTKYNFSEFKFNETSEYNRLNKCLNIIRRDERINAEFKNKCNQKFNGRPVVIERNGQYCVFLLFYEQVKICAYRGRVVPTSRYKEVACYVPVCRTIETIKKEKAYKYKKTIMETWKLEALQTIAQEIVDDVNESGKKYDLFTHDAHNIYLDCCYAAGYTDVEYYPDSGYEGGDLCGLELYNIDGCWIDEEGNETDLTDEEKQMLQDEVNKLIY